MSIIKWLNSSGIYKEVSTSDPLPVSASVSATVVATATAADPSYSEGTDNKFSQDLSGHLRVAASVTVSGFAPNGNFASLAVTNSSADVALPAGTDILVTNRGLVECFVNLTIGAGAATTSAASLLPGATAGFKVGSNTHISAITASGSTNLRITGGAGLAPSFGGDASGGSIGNLPTTVDTNSGNKSASTIRVVLATDQPALTNKLLVTPDSVALPANQSVNVAQINGVTTLMGNGASGTGAQRVTIANDSTGQIAVVPAGLQVEVIPTVTAGSYTATWVMGGIMTFANILPANFTGVLESITLKFKATVQTGEYVLAIFNASPAGGTYADHGAPTFNAADQVRLLGEYSLTANKSSLGTQTCYNLDGIAKAIVGTSTSLFAVLLAKGGTTNNLASTSDVSVILAVI